MIHLIYGGSGSGKSSFAEKLLSAAGGGGATRCYIATMWPADAEAGQRIARHRAEREHKGFVTIERYTGLDELEIPAASQVLLECLGNWIANEMYAPDGAGPNAEAAITRGLDHLAASADNLFVVANDVFRDGVQYPPETEDYRRLAAAVVNALARRSAVVVETVCGIPVYHKGKAVPFPQEKAQ